MTVKMLSANWNMSVFHLNMLVEQCKYFHSPLDNKNPIVLVSFQDFRRGKSDFFIVTWQGNKTLLPSLLLNSHYDVVPVVQKTLSCTIRLRYAEPTVLEDSMICSRGIQDMKSVSIGVDGLEAFLVSEQYKPIQPVAFAFDEDLVNLNDAFTVFYGERVP
ncbi:hypothetical protein KXD40_000915 [Peronospora effusa]|nr:hypothetical protein KXD40_000915 [Peronospora effusa]